MAIGMWRGTRARAAAAALGLRKGTPNVVVGLMAIMAAWLRCVGLALARARAYVAWLFHGTALLPGRSPEPLLWPLRAVVAGGASGRRRGTAGKAHALWPPIVVAVSVCHSNHLASCVTCLSYKKDVRHVGMCAKSPTNGMNVAAPRVGCCGGVGSKTGKWASKTNGLSSRSSQKQRRSLRGFAFGRAIDGSAAPRPYRKATK